MPELCRHFGTCGGCSSQDLTDAVYLAKKRERLAVALERRGISVEIEPFIRVGEGTRRRAVFKAKKNSGTVTIGFHATASHSIVDMLACRVLTPSLVSLVANLRDAMAQFLGDGEATEIHATEVDNGFDLALRCPRKISLSDAAALARVLKCFGAVRVTSNGELFASFGEPVVGLGEATVAVPPEAFLQPTREGERALQALVRDGVEGAKSCTDLFAGCGTFSLIMAEQCRVHAVEFDRPMLGALANAVRHTQGLKPVTTEERDLFRRPLTSRELNRFDAVVLDPPRAGAEAQTRQLASSRVRRVVYVSCDAQTFARDAKILIDGGFAPERLTPVDQFLWSEHIELVGVFGRGR